MIQRDAVKAYNSIKILNHEKLSGQTAKKVFLLFKALQPIYDFQFQEEEKVLTSHPMYDPQMMGVKLPDGPEEKKKALAELDKINAELKAIGDLECEVKFEKFDFDLSKENIKLSGEDIGNLEEFINFI